MLGAHLCIEVTTRTLISPSCGIRRLIAAKYVLGTFLFRVLEMRVYFRKLMVTLRPEVPLAYGFCMSFSCLQH